jgi:hypothetical protein
MSKTLKRQARRAPATIVLDPNDPAHADICAQLKAADDGQRAYSEWLETGAARDLKQDPFCNLCGRGQSEVGHLIGGGGEKSEGRVMPRIYLCDECVLFAATVHVNASRPKKRSARGPRRPAKRGIVLPEWVERTEDNCLRSVAEDAYFAKSLAEGLDADSLASCVSTYRAGLKALEGLENGKLSSSKRCAAGDRAARKFSEAKDMARELGHASAITRASARTRPRASRTRSS